MDEPPAIEEYRLELRVDFRRRTWAGTVAFDLPAGRGPIVIDADGLAITAVRDRGERVPYGWTRGSDRVAIERTNGGAARIEVEFSGQVVDRTLIGLYQCPHGPGYLLTTQCAPIGARRIFPCVDRPDHKARIRLTVRTDATTEVVSNAPVERTREGDGEREWSFAPTPQMATYLFYLAIGQFDRYEAPSGRVPVRTLAPPGRGSAGAYAAESAAEILAAYEEYYRIPYPLPKLDLIAVSEQAFGAMGNWGAICFRDMRLLVDGSSSSFARRNVFGTIAHEIAHQWFGNLVTMRWWDDIWLNESFATLLQMKITGALRPEFEPIHGFLIDPWGMASALAADSLNATHPIRCHVGRPEEISQIFDAISYGKGSSVLRMIEGYLGPEAFRAGVTDYLNRFRFANARTEDLWEALGRSAGRPVAEVVGPWVDREGFPVVRAELAPDGGLRLRQGRCSYHGMREAPPWPIPLQVDAAGERSTLLFDTEEIVLPVPSSATVHLNPGALGFYRVLYDPPLIDRLLDALPGRPAVDRWIVLEDLAAFVVSGEVAWQTFARAVDLLGTDTDRLVIEGLLGTLADWAITFPELPSVQNVARRFVADHFDRIGAERRPEEPEGNRILREALSLARVRIDPGFARSLAERFVEWDRLDPDLRGAVAIARARTDGSAAFREILRAVEQATTEDERFRFERALAWCGEPEGVDRTLEFVRGGGVRSAHVVAVLGHVAANPVGRPRLGPWLETNLPRLAEEFRGSMDLSMLLDSVVPLVGLVRKEDTLRYFGAHPFPEGARGLASGLEALDVLEQMRMRLTDA